MAGDVGSTVLDAQQGAWRGHRQGARDEPFPPCDGPRRRAGIHPASDRGTTSVLIPGALHHDDRSARTDP